MKITRLNVFCLLDKTYPVGLEIRATLIICIFFHQFNVVIANFRFTFLSSLTGVISIHLIEIPPNPRPLITNLGQDVELFILIFVQSLIVISMKLSQ